jgi:nucleoside-diphosphate-sugar epimerase
MSGRRADFERGTVWGTKNVVASCLKHKVKRLVYVSSMSVLDHSNHKHAVTESSPLEPFPEKRGFYTQSKKEAELRVRAAIQEQDLPAVIVRPGQIFGPGAKNMTPPGTIKIAGRWFVVGNGRSSLPLVFVEDVVDALLSAAEAPGGCGRIFHLADSEAINQREYIAYCRKAKGKKLKVFFVPRTAFLLAGAIADLAAKVLRRNMPISAYRIRSIAPSSNIDTTPASECLGWHPKVGVREGLRITFEGSEPARMSVARAM